MCEDTLNELDDFSPCKGEYIDTESRSQNIPSLKNLYLYVTEKQLYEIQEKINDMMFIPEYITVVMDSEKQYET